MRSSIKGSVAIAVLAIAFSADALFPDMVPPIFAGQAFAASANSNGNGNSNDNNGNGGQSAEAGSGNGSSGASPASGQGQGGGLLRLLATGSAVPSSTGGASTAGVATGAPLQLLSSHANGGTGSPVTAYVMDTVEPGQAPGEIHRMLGAGHGYFNSDEHAKVNSGFDSRIQRVERYLQANAAAQPFLAAVGGVPPSDMEYADALAYLEAQAVLDDLGSTVEEIAAAQAIIDGISLLDAAAAQLIVDAFEAFAAVVAAFEEADNRPYDEDRRAVYDDLALELGL